MSAHDNPHSEESSQRESEPYAQTRIDAAHIIAGAPSPAPEAAVGVVVSRAALAANESVVSPQMVRRLRLQAEQIAAHLRAEQQEIDHRQAQLNAQGAQQESDVRGARLWLRERHQELADRAAELQRRETAVEQRETELAQSQRSRVESQQAAEAAAVSDRLAADKQVAEQFAREAARFRRNRERTLLLVRQYLRGDEIQPIAACGASDSTYAADLGPDQDIQPFEELASLLRRLQARQRHLDDAEALLLRGQTELENHRRQGADARSAWMAEREFELQRAAESRRRGEMEIEQRQEQLTARAEHLERRSAAVDQLRAELLRTQRETLELRLATDEVWAQLAGRAPPAALTQSLARIRGKLAEQYRHESAELSDQKRQMESLAARLQEQHQKLSRQKHDLEQSAATRQMEIEAQAARLAARERQLDRQQAELDRMRHERQNERQSYEREIRRLLAELRGNGLTTRAA